MISLAELIDDLIAHRRKLPELFDALGERGPQPDEVHRDDIALLERMGEEGTLPAAIARALLAKLKAVQQSAPITADDATVVKPPSPAEADVTQVKPAMAMATGDAEATVVKPASGPSTNTQNTGHNTSSHSGSSNRDTWARVAQAEGGEYATVGMLLKGRFLLEREIGRGGMGVVYLARDERKVEARDRDPYVAVKVLNDEFRRHPDSLIALQREARRSQLLAHDNIVRVFDFDKDGTIVFMTMEYVDGQDLKALIRDRYNGMPLGEARQLIEGMAWALKRAHSAGVVHSDFKPGNVMVTREGIPKVFDFGIARAGKHAGDASGEQTLFDAGTLGALTPAYASLEMIQGKEPTPSDDIYALGCVAFELLTGKHPFDKVSAEVAQREGRKPPPVPGLTKRQYKALCDAVAFHGEQRLKAAVDLVEGLRDVSLRERIGPQLAYGSGALVLLVAAGWGATHYLHARNVQHIVARFAATAPDRYASEDQAAQALDTLSDSERKGIVLDNGDAIQNYLLSRIDGYWDPARKHYDYAATQHVFQLRDQLKLYSPTLDAKRSAIDEQKNELLNALDTQLTQRIDAGAIFENQPDNAVETLAQIRAIDPHSDLLNNAELELKYDIAIGQAIAANHAEDAKADLATATRLFPNSARLKQRQAQLTALGGTLAATPTQPAAPAQSLPEARKSLATLIAKPSINAEWQQQVANVMSTLRSDNAPDTRKLVNDLASAIATQAGQQNDPLQWQQASNLVNLGLQYAPQSSALRAQRSRLDGLLQQQQAQLNQESIAAEVTSRIESVKRAAAANDIGKAEESLARIRTLQPDNAFLSQEGPQLVATAYLDQAKTAVQRGRYQSASELLGKGMKSLGARPDLRNAKGRYDLLAAVMTARGKPISAGDLDRMQKQLADARRVDADGLKQLEADLKQRGALQGTLADLLDSMKASAAAASTPPPSNPTQPAATPNQPTPTPGAAAGKSAANGKPATATNGAPASANLATPNTAATAGSDPCNQSDLIGKGKVCFDALGQRRGPSLVVIPGVSGGKPYALSRAEITVAEFNRFCSATGQCSAKTSDDPEGGSLPISNITLAQAKAYAAWLSSASGGYVYRLPTDAEWTHAAKGGGNWSQASDSNCIPPTAGSGDDNTGAPISARGREANPWGLVNMTGNVWEWVTSGGGASVRGGSFTSYWSDCTVNARRDDSGAAQKDVGFRVLRELK
ncbi:protein kinase [Dyella sp.]|uniref:protein kinase domain-containing protein n=1 Tax=Dyella sp. TaxID=1869338 RepID=UPI002FDB78A9